MVSLDSKNAKYWRFLKIKRTKINLFIYVYRVLEILLKLEEFVSSTTVKITVNSSLLSISSIILESLLIAPTAHSQESSTH